VEIQEKDEVVYFPNLEEGLWKEVSSDPREADHKNEFNFTFKVYEKTIK